jgi:hypothetical protein
MVESGNGYTLDAAFMFFFIQCVPGHADTSQRATQCLQVGYRVIRVAREFPIGVQAA